MKNLFTVFMILIFSAAAIAQQKDVEVYEKKDGDNVIVMARNTGKCDYKVKLTITSQGMDVAPAAEVEAVVPAGFMKEMATITPRPAEAWSYSYNVSITQLLTKTNPQSSTPAVNPPAIKNGTTTTPTSGAPKAAFSNAEIILYAKPGCGRCSFVRKKMDALNIQYLEIDTHSDSPEVNNMWAQMRSQGFPGGSVTMPVVRVNGKYHWDIKDLEGFVQNLK